MSNKELDSKFNIGDQYIHYKNNQVYEIIDTGLVIQEDQCWINALMYKGISDQTKGHSNKIVRSEKEFEKKFKKAI